MAISMPPGVPGAGPLDLGPLGALMGAGSESDRTVDRLRPVLRLITDLKDYIQNNEDLEPIIRAIVQAQFGARRAARQDQARRGPPMAPGGPLPAGPGGLPLPLGLLAGLGLPPMPR